MKSIKCENCLKLHNGNYGSGRFCSKKCAKGFSTKSKRSEINLKVSEKLEGRFATGNHSKKVLTKEDIYLLMKVEVRQLQQKKRKD